MFNSLGHSTLSLGPGYPSPDLLSIMNRELEIYRWHAYGKVKSNYLSNCWHSISRQFLAQDPVLYVLAVLASGANNHRMISYPFPPMVCGVGPENGGVPGMVLPLNIRQPLEPRAGEGVEMAFSLAKEMETNVLSPHSDRLREWVAWKRQGGSWPLPELCVSMDDEPAEAYKVLGCFPQSSPCEAGEVRIRKTEAAIGIPKELPLQGGTWIPQISPHYLPVVCDPRGGYKLGNEFSGSFEDVARANRDLTALPLSPWGAKTGWNNEGYRFPAAFELGNVWFVGCALMGGISWESPLVQAELAVLFGPDEERSMELVERVRKSSARRLQKRVESVQKAEQRIFGQQSCAALPPDTEGKPSQADHSLGE